MHKTPLLRLTNSGKAYIHVIITQIKTWNVGPGSSPGSLPQGIPYLDFQEDYFLLLLMLLLQCCQPKCASLNHTLASQLLGTGYKLKHAVCIPCLASLTQHHICEAHSCVSMYFRSSLLLLKYFIVRVYHPSWIYSTADGSLACFQLGALVIRVAMDRLVHTTRCVYAPAVCLRV